MNDGKSLIVVGSIAQVARDKGITEAEQLEQTLEDGALIAICDTSGSMAMQDTPHGSRWDAVDAELAKLQGEYPGQVIVVSFSDEAMFCLDGKLHRYDRGTDLWEGLELIKDFADLATICVLTDGVVDDEQACFVWMRDHVGVKLNAVYIGSDGDPNYQKAMEFLRELVRLGGGGQAAKSVRPGMLSASVKRMGLLALPAGRAHTGTIIL